MQVVSQSLVVDTPYKDYYCHRRRIHNKPSSNFGWTVYTRGLAGCSQTSESEEDLFESEGTPFLSICLRGINISELSTEESLRFNVGRMSSIGL